MAQRYAVVLLGCLGMAMNYILRVNMNFAIVAMTAGAHTPANLSHAELNECHFLPDNHTQQAAGYDQGEFEWNELTNSAILAAFYWGCFFSQVPGGRLADRVGGRNVIGGGIALAALSTFTIPAAARAGAPWLVAARTLLGLLMGPVNSSYYSLLSYWAPPCERSTMTTIVFAGAQLGTVVGYPLTEAILVSWGWEAVFYVEGVIALAWSVLWFSIVSNSPKDCRFIKEAERKFIESKIGQTKDNKSPPVPWKEILTSPPMWALTLCFAGYNWGFYTLLTDLPLYMKEMLKFDIRTNALLSATPYIGMFSFSLLTSNVCDLLVRRKLLPVQRVRKAANCVAQLGPALCLIFITVFECERNVVIALLFLAVGLQGAICSGPYANTVELAPNLSGTVAGLNGQLAVMPGFIAPITVGALTNGQETLAQWRKVFYICAVVYMANTCVYCVFGSSQEQPWNRPAVMLKKKKSGGRSSVSGRFEGRPSLGGRSEGSGWASGRSSLAGKSEGRPSVGGRSEGRPSIIGITEERYLFERTNGRLSLSGGTEGRLLLSGTKGRPSLDGGIEEQAHLGGRAKERSLIGP